jgi:hypothetical protein
MEQAMAAIRLWSVKSNRRTVFSVISMLRCYKQDKSVCELVCWITAGVFLL